MNLLGVALYFDHATGLSIFADLTQYSNLVCSYSYSYKFPVSHQQFSNGIYLQSYFMQVAIFTATLLISRHTRPFIFKRLAAGDYNTIIMNHAVFFQMLHHVPV